MSIKDVRKYLPTEETMRRVADRARSEENYRRALENVRRLQDLDRAAEQAPPALPIPAMPPAAAPSPAPGEARAATAAPARPWRKPVVIALLVMSVTAPAALMYWLFVPRAGETQGGVLESPRRGSPPDVEPSLPAPISTSAEPSATPGAASAPASPGPAEAPAQTSRPETPPGREPPRPPARGPKPAFGERPEF